MSIAAVHVQLCVLRSEREAKVSDLDAIPGVRVISVDTEPVHQVDTFITVELIPDMLDDPFTTLLAVSQEARYLSVSLVVLEEA
jgi:hypothetical protein